MPQYLNKYALRYKRQNKLLFKKFDHKNDNKMYMVENYLSCSVVSK